MSTRVRDIAAIERATPRCRRCPQLRDYCSEVGRQKRRAYADWTYWGKPVPGFGDPEARLWVVGLAPAAHGANRTGRVFTGDRSGDFLYAALFRAGYANQAESSSRKDGLELQDAYVSAAARCAPPKNKPRKEELERCSSYLDEEHHALHRWRVLLALGGIAWKAALELFERQGCVFDGARPRFGHGTEFEWDGHTLLGSYHVSQQNTFTGRLTPDMFDAVLQRARALS